MRVRDGVVSLLVVAAVGLSGCVATQTLPTDGADLIDERTLDLSFGVSVRGNVNGTFTSRSLPVRIRTLTDPALGNQRFLLVESAEPIVLDTGTTVHPGLNLIGYHGDGSYEFGSSEPRTPDEGTTNAGSLSNGWMEYHGGDVNRLFRIGECRTDVRDSGRSGTLECPTLRDDEGKTVALTLTWGDRR